MVSNSTRAFAKRVYKGLNTFASTAYYLIHYRRASEKLGISVKPLEPDSFSNANQSA